MIANLQNLTAFLKMFLLKANFLAVKISISFLLCKDVGFSVVLVSGTNLLSEFRMLD